MKLSSGSRSRWYALVPAAAYQKCKHNRYGNVSTAISSAVYEAFVQGCLRAYVKQDPWRSLPKQTLASGLHWLARGVLGLLCQGSRRGALQNVTVRARLPPTQCPMH